MIGQLDEHATGGFWIQERDSFSLGANARLLVYELNAGAAAALQCCVEIVDREANVVNARPPFRQEFPNWRRGVASLQKLYQRLARSEPHNAGAIGIVQRNLRQIQYVPEKWNAFGKSCHCDADVGNTGATRT